MTVSVAKPNTDFVRKSICHKAVVLWNSLNSETRVISDANCFKKEF